MNPTINLVMAVTNANLSYFQMAYSRGWVKVTPEHLAALSGLIVSSQLYSLRYLIRNSRSTYWFNATDWIKYSSVPPEKICEEFGHVVIGRKALIPDFNCCICGETL